MTELTPEQKRALALARARRRMAEEDEPGLDDVRGAVQSFNRGTMLGWQDEIVGAGRAVADYGIAKLLGEDTGGQSFRDRYEMYRDEERDITKEFEDKHKKTALTLSLAGGIMSPVNRIAPGFGTGGGKKAATQALARALAEGGAAGLGESEAEDLSGMASDARTGAAFAGGTTVGLRAAGKLISPLVRRRVAEDLVDETGRRKPLHLVDEPVGRVYRPMASMPGASGRLSNLEDPFVDEAVKRAQDAEAGYRAVKEGIEDNLRGAKQSLKDAKESAMESLQREADTAIETAKDTGKALGQDRSRRFMASAARASLPDHAQHVLDDVPMNRADRVADAIKGWWGKHGFEEVKVRQFPWGEKGAKELRSAIRERVSNDPDLVLELGNALAPITKMTQRLKRAGLAQKPRTAEEVMDILDSKIEMIDGGALMAMRNVFATGANGTSKNGYALRQIANEFDDFIRKNMDEEAVRAFDQTLDRYTTALTYVDVSRNNKVGVRGNWFNPNEWLSSAKKYGGKGMSSKRPPLRPQANAAARMVDDAAQEAKDLPRLANKELKAKKSALTKAMRHRERAAEDQARNAKRVNERRRIDGDVAQTTGELADLKVKTLPRNKTILSNLLSAEMAGSALPTPAAMRGNRALNVARGVGVGGMIGSDTFQDLLAGQTGIQQAMMAALIKGDMAQFNRLLARQAAMEGVQ